MFALTTRSNDSRSRCRTTWRVVGGMVLAAGALAVTPCVATAQSETVLAEPRVEIGKPVPDFAVRDLEGKQHRLSDYKGKIVILEWFNPECPFVAAQHKSGPLKDLGNKLDAEKGIVFLAINSGAPGKQGTGLEKNKKYRTKWGMKYPLLLDESGKVGRLFKAKTSPHMFVIDVKGVLVYGGAIDNAPMGRVRGKGEFINYVTDTVSAVRAGETVVITTTKPYGCSVKYAPISKTGGYGGGN